MKAKYYKRLLAAFLIVFLGACASAFAQMDELFIEVNPYERAIALAFDSCSPKSCQAFQSNDLRMIYGKDQQILNTLRTGVVIGGANWFRQDSATAVFNKLNGMVYHCQQDLDAININVGHINTNTSAISGKLSTSDGKTLAYYDSLMLAGQRVASSLQSVFKNGKDSSVFRSGNTTIFDEMNDINSNTNDIDINTRSTYTATVANGTTLGTIQTQGLTTNSTLSTISTTNSSILSAANSINSKLAGTLTTTTTGTVVVNTGTLTIGSGTVTTSPVTPGCPTGYTQKIFSGFVNTDGQVLYAVTAGKIYYLTSYNVIGVGFANTSTFMTISDNATVKLTFYTSPQLTGLAQTTIPYTNSLPFGISFGTNIKFNYTSGTNSSGSLIVNIQGCESN